MKAATHKHICIHTLPYSIYAGSIIVCSATIAASATVAPIAAVCVRNAIATAGFAKQPASQRRCRNR